MKRTIYVGLLICVDIILVTNVLISQSGIWHPEITARPRLLFSSSDIPAIVKSINENSLHKQLYNDLYNTAKLTSNDQRQRSQISKAAAFILAINLQPQNNSFAPVDSQIKTEFINKITEYLRNIDPTVKSPSTNYQWRALELMQFCEAYDLFLGIGQAADTTIENKLAQFATNAYTELNQFLVIQNNLSIKLASALGMAALTLNTYSSSNTSSQPATWIGKAMSFVDDVFWNIVSDPRIDMGYAESPYYFRYAMMSAAPFFYAMKNFNGDWTEWYKGKTIRCPWFDPRYVKLYDWAAKIRMPDGRLPAFDDSYLDSYFPELGIFSTLPNQPSYYAWKNYKNEHVVPDAELSSSMTGTYDFRAEYIASGIVQTSSMPSDWNPTQYIPDAGYAMFRNSWSNDATYLAMIGKHGRARTHESPIGSGHKQANETAIMLQSKGELLLTEPGYFNYDSRDSLIYSPHHNLILVDGKGPDSCGYANFMFGADAFLQDTLSSELHDIASVKTNYQNASITRRVYFIDNTYFIIRDNVSSGFQRTFTHQLHGIGLITDGTCSFDQPNQSAIWSSGNMKLLARVDAFSDASQNIRQEIVTRKHAPSYQKFSDHSALYSSIQGSNAQFVSLLFPFVVGAQPTINIISDENKIVHTIKSGSKTHMAITNKKGETLELKEPNLSIATDASFAFYSSDQTNPSDYNIIADDAGQMSVNERTILWSPSKITGVLQYTRSSIRGTLRGANLDHIELATEYLPATLTGKHVTRWFMSTHKIILECSGSDVDFEAQLTDIPVDVNNDDQKIPSQISLEQNYPNPFGAATYSGNSTTAVRFALPKKEYILLEVFNIFGVHLKTVMEGEYSAGEYSAEIHADDLPSGRYFYRLTTSEGTLTKSMVVLK